MTHNETSTGLTNPVEEICDMMKKKYPDVLILVDCVSSMGGMKIDVDGWELISRSPPVKNVSGSLRDLHWPA